MTLRFILAAAALACSAPEVVAAQAAPPRAAASANDTLALRRAVTLARANNPMLAARAADVRAAGARIRPAGTLPDPTLTLGAMNYMLPRLAPGGDPMTMNQVTLMQSLPINGTLGLRRGVARADSARAAFQAEAAALEVESAVRARYWALYHDDRALEIMARRRTVLQEIAEMQLQRYGAASDLNALLGRPGSAPVVLPSASSHDHGAMLHTLDMPEPPALDSLIAIADAQSPEILGAGASVTGSRANASAVRRALIPDLGLGVAYGQRTGYNDMVSLMVSVTLPVFAASRQYRMRDEANAMLDVANDEQDAVRVRVHAALATAREQAMTARRLVALYAQTLVPQADATYQAALAAYRVGRVDFATLLDAQTALLEYEHDLHNYEAMYGTAVAEIDRLTGRPFDSGLSAGREN